MRESFHDQINDLLASLANVRRQRAAMLKVVVGHQFESHPFAHGLARLDRLFCVIDEAVEVHTHVAPVECWTGDKKELARAERLIKAEKDAKAALAKSQYHRQVLEQIVRDQPSDLAKQHNFLSLLQGSLKS